MSGIKKHIFDTLFGAEDSEPHTMYSHVINQFYQQKIDNVEEKTLFREIAEKHQLIKQE